MIKFFIPLYTFLSCYTYTSSYASHLDNTDKPITETLYISSVSVFKNPWEEKIDTAKIENFLKVIDSLIDQATSNNPVKIDLFSPFQKRVYGVNNILYSYAQKGLAKYEDVMFRITAERSVLNELLKEDKTVYTPVSVNSELFPHKTCIIISHQQEKEPSSMARKKFFPSSQRLYAYDTKSFLEKSFIGQLFTEMQIKGNL